MATGRGFSVKAKGTAGQDLLATAMSPGYLTFDFWESQPDYERFKSQYAAEYKAIDVKCEALTEQESEVGKLVVVRDGELAAENPYISSCLYLAYVRTQLSLVARRVISS